MRPKPAHIVAILAIATLAIAAWLHLRELQKPDFDRCPLCNQRVTVQL